MYHVGSVYVNVRRELRRKRPSQVAMNRCVINQLRMGLCHLKPDSRFESVPLRAVIDFNIVEHDLTASLGFPLKFVVIRNKDLTAPSIRVCSNKLYISRKHNYFCTHVYSSEVRLSGSCLAPVIETKTIL